jgi:hypothetical protein
VAAAESAAAVAAAVAARVGRVASHAIREAPILPESRESRGAL